MKTTKKSDKWQVTSDESSAECGVRSAECDACSRPRPSTLDPQPAFTLIELLVVISIIGVLAAFSIPVAGAVKRTAYLNHAKSEMGAIEAALDRYKAVYGTYPPSNPNDNLINQLYYELVGTTLTNNTTYTSLDGSSTIGASSVMTAYGVDGFVNCTKGSGEEGVKAQTFLPGLTANQIQDNGTHTGVELLATSVGGPLASYKVVTFSGFVMPAGVNPWGYSYPGTNNPGSYDLWVQIVIKPGQTNLICNWNNQVQINNPLP